MKNVRPQACLLAKQKFLTTENTERTEIFELFSVISVNSVVNFFSQ